MSSEAKRVKLLTLAEMFLGLIVLIGGIVAVFMGPLDVVAGIILAAEGLVSLIFGARGALIANVPARIGKLARIALIIQLVQIVSCVAIGLITGADEQHEIIAIVCGALLPVISLVILILSRGMEKHAER
ncbi:MAG: hypothetical protein IKF14_03740 [Atopobiaceae bacterium]|nr:hypothetical protein [Atopobiaceae bacterium]